MEHFLKMNFVEEMSVGSWIIFWDFIAIINGGNRI